MTTRNNRNASPVLFLAAAVALSCGAAGCSKKQPETGSQPQPVVFKPQAAIPASFTLQKAEGQTGRTSAIGNNYRPQVRFAAVPDELTCGVDLPAATPSLEPGQTADVSLRCDAEIRVDPSKREFTVTEGGKPVGQGVVRLP